MQEQEEQEYVKVPKKVLEELLKTIREAKEALQH
jgi:hypothetical protein